MKIFLGLLFSLFTVSTVWADDLLTATPEEVGLSSERLALFDSYMKRQVDDQQVAGIRVLVARQGKVVYHKSAGMADVEASIPVDENTIFGLNSMTKPITSVAAMMLYEQGYFLLTDPVSKYLPELAGLKVYVSGEGSDIVTRPAAREMTIQDLLRHTAGLTNSGIGFGEHPQVSAIYDDKGIGYEAGTLAAFITRLSQAPLIDDPGSRWEYSTATNVLARLVEVVSGVQFDVFLKDNILDPLGMKNTGHFVTGTDVARLTAHYEELEDGSLKQHDQSTGHYTKKPTFFAGSTGLVSTSTDYFRFSQMLLNGGALDGVRILGPRTVAFMTQNHVSPETKRNFMLAAGHGFGLGFDVLLDNVQHGSPMSEGTYFWVGSAGCFFFIDPVEELVVIVMVQRTPQIVTTMKPEVEALVYQAIVD